MNRANAFFVLSHSSGFANSVKKGIRSLIQDSNKEAHVIIIMHIILMIYKLWPVDMFGFKVSVAEKFCELLLNKPDAKS